MIRSKVTFIVNRPIEQVFSYAINHEHFSLWLPGVVSTYEISDIPLRVGSTFKHFYLEGKKQDVVLGRILHLIENQKITYLATSKDLWFRRSLQFTTSYEGTMVEYTEERMREGLGYNLMAPLLYSHFQKINAEGCENLRKILESQPANSFEKSAATTL